MMDINIHFALSLLARLCLVVYGYFQDACFEVKYTDVDYKVFTDAAQYVSQGHSPFRRPTYRYTPALAFLVLPNVLLHDAFGKVLFCVFDVLTSILIYRIQKNCGFSPKACRASTFLWLYNPLPAVISSRGNAESLMTFLVALCVLLGQERRPALLGLVYGLAVHFKIYPCIYALSLYFALEDGDRGTQGWERTKRLLLPSRTRAVFVLSSGLGFLVPTLLSLYLYGEEYLREALLYHLTRKDTRHNFSPYFYLLYLMEGQTTSSHLADLVSVFALFLQATLVAVTSWTFRSLPVAMFLQTFLFVTFNKVCTSQYFMWHLCLLPFVLPLLKDRSYCKWTAAWLTGQALWLVSAYMLEFQGKNTFMLIFLTSIGFFLANVYLVCSFVKCVVSETDVCTAKKNKVM